MLFRETVGVYCENHTEHTDTLCGQKEGFTTLSQVVDMVAALSWRLRARGFTLRFRGLGNFKPELECAV
jgi:hypothetical protein